MQGLRCSLLVDKKSTLKQKLSEQINIKMNAWTCKTYRLLQAIFVIGFKHRKQNDVIEIQTAEVRQIYLLFGLIQGSFHWNK